MAARPDANCHFAADAIEQQSELRDAAIAGDADARQQYNELLQEHARQLAQCRRQTWPPQQAIWLRLYPCDLQTGAVDAILDDIVARGYNQVYVEAFYDGQVLLPVEDNPTPWPSALRAPGTESVDLLAQAIAKGRERGLRVYAWMFSLNFGYSYTQDAERQPALALNGRGQNTLDFIPNASQVFVDPYHLLARQDYARLVQAVLQRQPDGVLFDYIRYPRGIGGDSVADTVSDLWIYSDASRAALLARAENAKSRLLIERYLERGYLTADDLNAADKLGSGPARWQGRPSGSSALQRDLWRLSVAHAAQGVIDFLNAAAQPVRQRGLPAGAVFFPDGNQIVGAQGFDSRLQPWAKFPSTLEWHAMSYGVCGKTDCISDLVQRVVDRAPSGTRIIPALAGDWGRSYDNRPPLEAQMNDLHRRFPQIQAVSHFSYEWQTPELARERKFCPTP
ncbi:hypothetical protein KR51_00013380 [Rubidibacter lacunae KORDI 51-2]|uniref:Glycosyl hydrolase-like 10 domain-containing protein n=1 Tax=Rubidibacter lacunae KORDI 51-2 TaxID=582515 RepID=U5DN12_9CHRO|nr:family 10 glycosylhydrolase [Rubidibacter lacunae]ERN42004.1 hypothetical protein KR51_00013380 [Rubidibacter lacunae KORDI 51-2]